ncbi:predicted protein [Micromonas commoda]|uniref:Uncharacterized protein n=1 Tax=Micromonas commoda (strain RCC299 / NOUM17 / CCMP2709) TaxID=296587 RepID=C1DYR0_MICCC|nr:predicted protein [Micromonas commoda]ACO61471.1 predicted protein [Micromonas commoda]|eukprot:XP_002500213.1 predicted protein [Micromonas commoda]
MDMPNSGDRSNGAAAPKKPESQSGAAKKKKKKGGGGGPRPQDDAAIAARVQLLEELDNAPQPQREEQWSTVSKNALPKTVAKTVAKAVVKDPSSVAESHATGHAFGALTKFMEADGDGDGDGDESGDEPGEASAGAFNVSDFKVSRPFYHTFEDTGKGVWCCVVTSPSGFDSAPIPITATVKRAGKLKPNSPPPALVPEEEAEVVLDFKRRQKEERKKAAAEGGKKKKKKKKGGGAAAAEDAPPPPDTSEVIVTQNPLPSGPEDKARLSKEILDDLFAASAYRPPTTDAVPDPNGSDNFYNGSDPRHDSRGPARGVPPPPGLGGFVRPVPTRREEHVESPPLHAERPATAAADTDPPLYAEQPATAAADSAAIVAQMQAQMARMMQAQQGALISQQAAALEQAQAQMLAMQRQMAEMQRQLEETRAREAAAPRRGPARGERSAASERDWRADAPGPVGVEALEANPRDKSRGGSSGAGNGGVRPNPFRRTKQAPAVPPPPGFEPKPRDPNAYVPPALRGAARE